MAGDASYNVKNYEKQGGDEWVIGGKLTLENGSQVVAPNISGAKDYYVDLNVTTAAAAVADGLSWGTAFQTIAEAITASNLSIGLTANRWWARRNRIFVCGDGITENLTVLPEKCDIIGVGSDLYPFPRVIGHHTIAVAKVGCRFINMGFQSSGTGPTFTIPASSHGLQFKDCTFTPTVGGSTIGLSITDTACVRIDNCRFQYNAGGGIYAMCISILGTVGHETEISNNRMTATAGILVATGINATGCLIVNNIIRATALAINDVSGLYQVVNNRWMTDINTGTSTAGYVFTLALAAGNLQMGATGLCDTVPFTKIAE